MAAFDRLAELRDLYSITRDSISEAPADRRAPLIARAESLAQQIESLAGEGTKPKGDPIDEISARRAARGGATARPRRAATDQG